MEREERFKAGLPAQEGEAGGRQIVDLDDQDAKIKARMERFKGDAPEKTKKGALEFTLDEYKSKKNKNGFKKDKFNKKNGFKNK